MNTPQPTENSPSASRPLSLKDVIDQIEELWKREPDPVKKESLFNSWDHLIDSALELASVDIGNHKANLNKVIEQLQSSIDKLKKAKREMEEVAENIKAIAKAADQLADIAKMAAAA